MTILFWLYGLVGVGLAVSSTLMNMEESGEYPIRAACFAVIIILLWPILIGAHLRQVSESQSEWPK